MADPNAFSVMRAAQDLSGRGRQVNAAVDAAAPPGAAPPASNMQAGRERAMNMGGAPSGAPKQAAYGAPIQSPSGAPVMASENTDAAPVPEQPQQLVSKNDGSISSVAQTAREKAKRQDSNIATDKPATEEEQAEYQRSTDMLSKVMYEDPNTSMAIIDSLNPENKVGSVAQTAILVLSQLDNKADLDESVIPQMTQDIVDRLMDLGEQTKGMTFSDEEAQGALGAAWEGVMQLYGTGDANDFAEATQGMTDDELKEHTSQYRQMLGSDF